MAVSIISGDFGIGYPMTCILYEGVLTVNTNGVDITGHKTTVVTPASPLSKGSYVCIDAGTENTYTQTGGLPVVKTVAAGAELVGVLTSHPHLEKMPGSTKTPTNTSTGSGGWGDMLIGGWYRTATVEWIAVTGAIAADIATLDAAAITPGAVATVEYDVSEAAWVDVASGGVMAVPAHYVAKGTANFTCLLLFKGSPLVGS